jgi:hypothetical protein
LLADDHSPICCALGSRSLAAVSAIADAEASATVAQRQVENKRNIAMAFQVLNARFRNGIRVCGFIAPACNLGACCSRGDSRLRVKGGNLNTNERTLAGPLICE